ncbi:MAG: 4-hydroxy-tetrahydrodipicolinate synthase [Nevskiaceae bacterium]|jgi:4-hydroxy-tetrahydrodipicolinate synthase|nr:4-hydroxy-tetrahydrodipicolinate synthase [Nevskiaceae bacterium]
MISQSLAGSGLAGSHVAIVTPFCDDGSVDWPAWGRLLDFHLAAGTTGIIVGGTTGESPVLLESELRELVARAAAQVGGRIKLIVGAGTSSTASTVERARAFSALPGVDALLIVTPAYNRPPQEGLYRHFEAAAAASAVPVILYNVPSRTAVDMLPETVARLARVPGIIGLKEAVASMQRVRDLLALCPADFALLSGDDGTCREAIALGACGVISVTANIAPAAMSQMVQAALAGQAERAAEIDTSLSGLHRAQSVETNPIPAKWALHRMGLIRGALRLPLTGLSAAHHVTVEQALALAGISLAAAA